MNIKLVFCFVSSFFLCCSLVISAVAQTDQEVKWVTEKENAALWARIRSDFHDELQPDDPVKVAPVLAYSYKYISRVAVYQKSAVVIVGHLETKESKYPGYYSAFNYLVESRARRPIKGAEVISVFKFVKFVSLDAPPQDIFFTWLTCTECEASRVLSAFHYDANRHEWTLRSWEANKDIWWTSESGPVIWADVSASDTISFECLHGFVESTSEVVFAIRCRDVAEPEEGKRKVTDITARYRFKGAESKLETVTGENRTKLLVELCEGSPKNKLCKNIDPGKQ